MVINYTSSSVIYDCSNVYSTGYRRFEKIANFFKTKPKKSPRLKRPNICIEAQFESPKHLHQNLLWIPLNTFNKLCLETAYLCKNVKYLLMLKVA
jgi:hypothetical protein